MEINKKKTNSHQNYSQVSSVVKSTDSENPDIGYYRSILILCDHEVSSSMYTRCVWVLCARHVRRRGPSTCRGLILVAHEVTVRVIIIIILGIVSEPFTCWMQKHLWVF